MMCKSFRPRMDDIEESEVGLVNQDNFFSFSKGNPSTTRESLNQDSIAQSCKHISDSTKDLNLAKSDVQDISKCMFSSDQESSLIDVSDTTPLQDPRFMDAPEWTPRPCRQASRTPLPSTRVRVTPSPYKGGNSSSSSSQCSPVITVSTTTTPIQPLQGNKQRYVIVQGNHRHLKGLESYKDTFCTPTAEESHQPIYLQGLPPQGFRRLWKCRENTCTERPTKRSLDPLFCKASAAVNQEATVPEMEKSPLTCIRGKISSDREVPERENSKSPVVASQETPEVSISTRTTEEENDQGITDAVDSECQANKEGPLGSGKETVDEVTIIPVSHGKCRENRERKKIRDRKYDADLKMAFEQLRRIVPRLQKSYSRGLILQETIKYIGNLEKKITDAGLQPTLQAEDQSQRDTQSKSNFDETSTKVTSEPVIEAEHVLSPTVVSVPDTCNDLSSTIEDETTFLSEGDTALDSQENAPATLTSPVILSLSVDEGSYSFVSPEGAVLTDDGIVSIEEVPLSIPFQQVQLLPVDPNDDAPVLTPRYPDEPLLQELNPRLIPLVEVPCYTETGDCIGMSHGEDISSLRDLIVSVIDGVSTISHEGLSDLGVTLSPLLSPLGILLSPGADHTEDPTVAVLGNGANSEDENRAGTSAVVPGVCSDMTTIAASVEVTTDKQTKRTPPSVARTRRSPRLRTAQTVPSLSPVQAGDCKSSTSRGRNRRVLQDCSNFEDLRSPVPRNRRGSSRKLKDATPEQSLYGTDENAAFTSKQTCTPPGRVSGVVLSTKRKTPSPRGGVDKKSFCRM